MLRVSLLFCLLLSLAGATLAQSPKKIHSLTGYLRDAATQKPIAGATVFVQDNRKGVTTDAGGFFVISLEEGSYSIRFSHIGYIAKVQPISLKRLTLLNVELAEDTQYLQEVVVQTEAVDRNIKKVEIGVTNLSIKSIRRIPAFLGEVDVVRSLLLLPGVTTVGEGATGLNIRGGSIDQNLILQDDAPLFNTSHLLGFFSVFNSDVVSGLTLQRGGIAPTYGGRASAVVDIKIKEPETERWAVNGGIGLISSRIAVEGPVSKKFSVLAAGRLSANDFLFAIGPQSLRGTKANFYDFTTKLKYQFNESHTLTFTGYHSNDLFKLPSDSLSSVEVNSSSTTIGYRSTTGTLRWNYFINNRLNLTTNAIFSRYQNQSSSADSANAFLLAAEVQHRQLKTDLTFTPSEKHQFMFGISAIDYFVQPNRLTPGAGSNVSAVTLPTEQAYELAAYAQDEWKLSERTSLLGGLRFSALLNRGPFTANVYGADLPRTAGTAISTTTYGQDNVYHTSAGLEPRLALRWTLGEGESIKIGYNRMRQYIHLVTNTTAALPTSRWKLSDQNIKPQIADQLSAGYFRNTTNNIYELSGEVYYKQLTNAIDYKDGANLLLNPLPETDLVQGKGQAYGLELLARKNKGTWTGWASYTYARTFLTMDSRFASEQVNNGTRYPANFDKPHTLNVTATYRPSLRFSLSLNFTYSTGRPITQPYARARVNGVVVPIFVNRNQERIPDYHRLDFSMNFEEDPIKAKTRRFHSSWVFAVYNVYAHKNAYSVFYRFDPRQFKDAFKLSIFGSVFPSLTWNFKF
jgi:ferric enterobactin receptor